MPIHFTIGKSKMPDAMTKSIMFMATPVGREKVNNYEGSETPWFRVLVVITEEGPCSIEEISQQAHVSQSAANHHVKDLMKKGFIKRVSQTQARE